MPPCPAPPMKNKNTLINLSDIEKDIAGILRGLTTMPLYAWLAHPALQEATELVRTALLAAKSEAAEAAESEEDD